MVLYPVSVDILYDGMMVDFGIYYFHKGNYVLLCKDVVLTPSMIDSIKATLNFSSNVYMSKDNRDRALRETAYFEMAQLRIEQKIGYDIMKDIARDFVNKAYETGMVPLEIVDNLVTEIETKLADYEDALVIQCLNEIRDLDKYLYIHSLNVGFLNGMMGKWCGFGRDYCTRLVKAGLVHDLGKLKISPEILNKPARLTALEYESVKRHPEFGHAMLRKSGEKDKVALDVALHHHERINTTGYPERLSGDEISTAARISAISDVYDAMVAERPYKGASTPFVILQELMDTSFSDLDNRYVEILLKNMIKELQGCQVLLSTGAVARVEYIDPRRPRYPIVSIDGEMVKTDEDICCVKIYPG